MKAEASKAKRQKAVRKGSWSEFNSAWYLRFKGYRILERNYRCKSGEIDIIAQKGNLIAFVEVKARATAMEAVDAVGYASQNRIRNAADHWISRQPDPSNWSFRFDIIGTRNLRFPTHYKDAF